MIRIKIIFWCLLLYCIIIAGNEHTVVFNGKPNRAVLASRTTTYTDSTCSEYGSCEPCIITKDSTGKFFWASRDSMPLFCRTDSFSILTVFFAENGRGTIIIETFDKDSIFNTYYTELIRGHPVIYSYFGKGNYKNISGNNTKRK